MTRVAVIGGGAAGFFYAINKAIFNPDTRITIFEQGKNVLNKVRISGGGRCNVTHACFDPRELIQFYPRGSKELLGPFNSFACGDTIAWFDERGVELKIEDDGRMFPVTDSSETIIECFLNECKNHHIHISTESKVQNMIPVEGDKWNLKTSEGWQEFDQIFLGTGSSSFFWNILQRLGHKVIPPVPSLFTFNVNDETLKGLPGVSVSNASVSIPENRMLEYGPLLITHWGLSGPAILKLSAWGARVLNNSNYKFEIKVDWIPNYSEEQIESMKSDLGGKYLGDKNPFDLPNRLWQNLIKSWTFRGKRWADLNKQELVILIRDLKFHSYFVNGKSTFKSEFVTAGGVDLKEINFKNFSSRLFPNLFMAGEVINVDAVTGGFNFQAAWTGAYLAALG